MASGLVHGVMLTAVHLIVDAQEAVAAGRCALTNFQQLAVLMRERCVPLTAEPLCRNDLITL
jgi:hypothetical protein